MYSRLTPSFSSPSPRAPLQKVNSFIPVPREHYMHELFIPKHRLASNCFNKCVWYCKKQLDVLLKPHAWLYSRLQTSVWVAWHTTSALCVCVCVCMCVCAVVHPQELRQTTDVSVEPHWGLPQRFRPRRRGNEPFLFFFLFLSLTTAWALVHSVK